MKKVLITGVNSYVGNKFTEWMDNYPDDYEVEKISLRNDEWRKMSFSEYDTVLHVAGVAHQKETKRNAHIYYKVNRDLAIEVAQKSKNDGVDQFIFLSSMSVYGLKKGVINKFTPTKPKSDYGKSKLEAESLLNTLDNSDFKIAILRPPMIYGKKCKGNYQRLSQFAINSPIFPDIYNLRSMIFIDNLSIFIQWLIDKGEKGLFFPQNKEYVCTTSMVKNISKIHNCDIKLTVFFNLPIKLFRIGFLNKIFGNLIYEKSLSSNCINKSMIDFEKSLLLTEDKSEKNSDTF